MDLQLTAALHYSSNNSGSAGALTFRPTLAHQVPISQDPP